MPGGSLAVVDLSNFFFSFLIFVVYALHKHDPLWFVVPVSIVAACLLFGYCSMFLASLMGEVNGEEDQKKYSAEAWKNIESEEEGRRWDRRGSDGGSKKMSK